MEIINKTCGFIILLIVVFCIGYGYGNKEYESKVNEPISIQDTTYNHIVLDSIQYNIIKKDSIIYQLKIDAKHEIEESNNLSDTATVNLFKQLATSKDEYSLFTGE